MLFRSSRSYSIPAAAERRRIIKNWLKNICRCDRIGHGKGKKMAKTTNNKFNLTQLLNGRSKEPEGITEERREEIEAEKQNGATKQTEGSEIVNIDVYDLVPSQDNFYHVDDELKRSIELVGILQPLLVSRSENGKYRVIAGHRRRLAALSQIGRASCRERV